MSTRRAKQLIYGALYVVLWLVFFTGIYFVGRLIFPPAPVVAPCTSDCIPTDASPITTSTIFAFVTSSEHYTLLTQLTNTSDYAPESFDYSFDLYDASGNLLASIPGQNYLYANQSKYLVVPNQIVQGTVASAALTISNPIWVPGSQLGPVPLLTTQNPQSSMTLSSVVVSGQITNADISTYRQVLVVVIFKGPNGAPVGASQTEIDNVVPGETTNFSVSYPVTTTINPANNSVFVYGTR